MTNNIFKQTEIGEIPEEWSKTNVGSLVSSISKTFDFSSVAEVVFLNTGDISEGKVLVHDKVSKIGLPGQAKKTIQRDDILLSEIRPKNKRFAYVDFDADDYVVSTKLMVLRSDRKVNPKFIYYHLTSEETLTHLQMLAESRSGTFPQITFDEVSSLDICLPQPIEQVQIVDFIQALDDKIKLNRRMNKTIGEIGKALFKRWFVDFEFPNENGEPYKSSGGEMVDSEMGEIPKDWKVRSLFELASYINGKAFKNKDFSDEGLPIIKIAELKNGISSGTNKSKYQYDDKYLLSKKDILFSWSGSPDTSIDCFIWHSDSGWLNQHIFKVVPQVGYSSGFIYFLLKYFMARFISIAHNKKTTGLGHVTVSDLKRIQTALPDEIEYIKLIDDMFENIYGNLREIELLEGLRDSLLPRLMSGNIRITV